MCGIAGALSWGTFDVDEPYVARMRDSLAHRGPDGAGAWISDDRRVGLGSRRLAIIDLSHTADQPVANEDGSIHLVYNGEIYNHAELRPELEQLGHRFRSDHSDTEVLVHAYEQWGADCLHRLRGMFAFALWDGRKRELWLVRDRIGIKPLYYAVHHQRLVFGSEIKALLLDPQQERAVDEESLFHYLSFLCVPAPRTLFRGIAKLEAGSWLRAGADGRVEERRWWDAWDDVDPLVGVSEREIEERVLEELRTSVRLRKVSDVPVGVFLSGGVDSSTNAALFSEGESTPVKTFSIGYDENYASYPNELEWARRMAAEVHADHHERVLALDDLLGFLPEMARLQDEPVADPVCFPLYYVAQLAREHGVPVAQAGEGADELFFGYPSWRTLLRLQRADDLPVPAGVKRLGLATLGVAGQSQKRPYEYLRRGAAGVPVFWGGAEAFTEAQKRRLLSPRLRRELGGLSSWSVLEPIRQRFDEASPEPSTVNWMTYLDLRLRLPELLLMRIDKMSMGVSLEARVPFLDHRLVSLALSIPTKTKVPNGELKHVLKGAVRGVIPDEIIDRPKQGFRVPVEEWMLRELGDRTRQEVAEMCAATDLLDGAEAARLLEQPGRSAWYLLNLAVWWREAFA
ncbi:MAG TPA: asparagine synthase (glutamine-hydrolyzing) [Gaiellaceae bacterium]